MSYDNPLFRGFKICSSLGTAKQPNRKEGNSHTKKTPLILKKTPLILKKIFQA
jgi:hypothetical protein